MKKILFNLLLCVAICSFDACKKSDDIKDPDTKTLNGNDRMNTLIGGNGGKGASDPASPEIQTILEGVKDLPNFQSCIAVAMAEDVADLGSTFGNIGLGAAQDGTSFAQKTAAFLSKLDSVGARTADVTCKALESKGECISCPSGKFKCLPKNSPISITSKCNQL